MSILRQEPATESTNEQSEFNQQAETGRQEPAAESTNEQPEFNQRAETDRQEPATESTNEQSEFKHQAEVDQQVTLEELLELVIQQPDRLQLGDQVSSSTSRWTNRKTRQIYKPPESTGEFSSPCNSDDGDENCMPSDEELNRCAVAGCLDEIFLACTHCVGFLCYDHMDTASTEHTIHINTLLHSDDDTKSCSITVSNDVDFCFTSESKKRKRSRRRVTSRHDKSNPNGWKKNKRKQARLLGQEYVNTSGVTVKAKQIIPRSCDHGRQKVFKCDLFCGDIQSKLFSDYYDSGDYARQRDFILNNTTRVHNETGIRRQKSVLYKLPLNGNRV